ncbi:MAG TPA: hypothetical protein VNW97_04280 [Candidatus Saccharimonadales bacterium]|jgi:hypothetical protein|nr:hypothetical protein [Candidatus Saccharimonadales bacterium]
MVASENKLRPDLIREIALWWQNRLDGAGNGANGLPESPSLPEVMTKFACSEEEALRGVCLGEYRHFDGVD